MAGGGSAGGASGGTGGSTPSANISQNQSQNVIGKTPNKNNNTIDNFETNRNKIENGNERHGKAGHWTNDKDSFANKNTEKFDNKSDKFNFSNNIDKKNDSLDRDTRNNTNNVRNAAEIASNSNNPYAKAAGGAVKAADKVTGGKASENIGKAMTKINQSSTIGKKIQNVSNKVSESDLGNKASKTVSSNNGSANNSNDKMMQDIKKKQLLNQQNSNIRRKHSLFNFDNDENDETEEQDGSSSLDEEESSSFFSGRGKFAGLGIVKIAVATILPLLLILFPIIVIITSVSNIISSFQYNFEISDLTGYDQAELEYTGNDEEQQFILRVNVIYETYLQSTGSYFDPHLVVSTYFILNEHGARLSFNDMTDSAIREIVRAMFKGLVYDKDTFRNNLILSIIPKYLPETTTAEREAIADAIFQHTEDYHKIRQDKAGGGNGGGNGSQSTGEFSKWKQYEGEWASMPMGNSGQTVKQIGCFVTSIAILIAKSGVPTTINPFNPGTFVEFLNNNGGFDSEGNFIDFDNVTKVAPTFKYTGRESNLLGMTREEKFNRISEVVNSPGIYAMVEVKGNTGQHWVALDAISGGNILMMDPGSSATNLWEEYNWQNTSTIITFKVG